MSELLGGIFGNESRFGKLMTRLGVMIGANLMFVIFCLPVFTIGASYAALYYVMLKALRGDGVINPFKEFFKGFRTNFKQGTVCWLIAIAIALFFYMDFRIVAHYDAQMGFFKYVLILLAVICAAVFIYLYMTMAAFEDTIPHLLRNAIYFAVKKPLRLIVVMFFNLFPMYLTYTDSQYLPLYGFWWVMIGYAAIAMLGAWLTLPAMVPYLPLVDECGSFIIGDDGKPLMPGQEPGAQSGEGHHEPTEKETLEMMKKMGM